jgi:endonuclease/exonuclease/phosphatase family metal-dependent hydrolase
MLKKNLSILFMLNLVVLAACTTAVKQPRTFHNSNIKPDTATYIQQDCPAPVLRVATLNIAHGRKDSINQLFVRESTFKKNLDDVAEVLNHYRPQVVALQEADAASRWSGSFDHVAYLAAAAGYPWRVHVSNAKSWLYSYGVALLSSLPLVETIEHTFEPSPPTLDKGFVLAEIEWPCGDDKTRKVDIISVHLDFSRESVREKQIHEMFEVLSARNKPTIIMGDFNSQWPAEVSAIEDLVIQTRFVTYEPLGDNHSSYKNKRLDWILITRDMAFENYQVLPDTLSDHAMVLADIRFK